MLLLLLKLFPPLVDFSVILIAFPYVQTGSPIKHLSDYVLGISPYTAVEEIIKSDWLFDGDAIIGEDNIVIDLI